MDHLSPKRLTTCLIGQAKYSALISAITIVLPQGQCKPNAIELARIAEVQPVLADFIGKIRHNILKEDGFENADPEISRVIPSYPEKGKKKAPELLRSDASSFVISCLSHIAIPECLYRITLSIWHTQSYQFFIDFLGINWQQDFLCVSQLF